MIQHIFSEKILPPKGANVKYWSFEEVENLIKTEQPKAYEKLIKENKWPDFIRYNWHYFVLLKNGGIWTNKPQKLSMRRVKSLTKFKFALSVDRILYYKPVILDFVLGSSVIVTQPSDKLMKKAVEIVVNESNIYSTNFVLQNLLLLNIIKFNKSEYRYYHRVPQQISLLRRVASRIRYTLRAIRKTVKNSFRMRTKNQWHNLYEFFQNKQNNNKLKEKGSSIIYNQQGSLKIKMSSTGELKNRSSDLPLISCLMVTSSNRINLAKTAIECFENQTYANKQLVLVEEQGSQIYEWIKTRKIDNLKYCQLEESLLLGAKRNLSLEYAEGEYFATWDDDDINLANRLEKQFECMLRHNAHGCFLASETMKYINSQFHIVTGYRAWENTLLLKKVPNLYYPELTRNEDTIFVLDYISRYKVVLLNMPELYTYRLHSENARSKGAHFSEIWKYAREISYCNKSILPLEKELGTIK